MQNTSSERGGVSKLVVGLLVVFGVMALVGVIIVGSGWSWRNDAIGLETKLKAKHSDAKNVMDNVVKRIREVAQVSEMYADDLTKVTTSAIEGRYGKDGSKAIFQWIQEHNPNVDSAIYVQIQRVIEAGRKEFQATQTEVLDVKRVYENHLRKDLGSVWASILGYPTVKLEDYKIVTSDRTEKAFETGKDEEIKLR